MKTLSRREFLGAAGRGILGASLAGGIAASCAAMTRREQEKPNFVFILIDDMGWMDTSCYGSRFYETPNIDRLAAQGMLFTDAYAACPVCSPTRASIMTGKYPARTGVTDFIPGTKPRACEKLIGPTPMMYLRPEEITIAEALKAEGYATGIVGKWHLGGPPYMPESQGFDVNVGGCGAGSTTSFFYPGWKPSIPVDGQDGDYLTDRLTDEAVKFIRANSDKPFVLYLAHYAVHVPIQAKAALIEKYKPKVKLGQLQDNPTYAAMIASVDESVGRVMRTLDELRISGRTAVFFTSDNGGLSVSNRSTPPTCNAPLRAGKGHLYEGGIREPLIVRWPGVVKPGSVCRTPVSSVDYFPTMLEMAGARTRVDDIDGRSIVPLLTRSGGLKRDALYWHYPHYGNQGGQPGSAIREGDLKLIKFYEDNRVELYNLRDDISERNDLAGRMPDVAARMERKLDAWLKSVDAKMPTPNPNYDPKAFRKTGHGERICREWPGDD